MTKEAMRAFHVPLFFPRSTCSTESNKTGSWSFIQPSRRDKTAPCSEACPCAADIPRIEGLAAKGDFEGAYRALLEENPLPAVCGHVCFHPCESACNRRDLDDAVSVNALERFIAETAQAARTAETGKERPSFLPVCRPRNGKSVAVLGAGPAGLSAASFLCRLGYECEIIDAESEAGGLLRWGIPEYRLPSDVLKNEIDDIHTQGVIFSLSRPVDEDFLRKAKGRYQAVVAACGYGASRGLDVPGGELALDGAGFLKSVRGGLSRSKAEKAAEGARVAVIGGGNSAVDVARTLVRMGSKPVIVYRRRRCDMPAFAEEVKSAVAEGVEILELRSPSAIQRKADGFSLSLATMKTLSRGGDGRMHVAESEAPLETFEAAAVYAAVGEGPAAVWMDAAKNPHAVRLARCALVFGSLPVAYAGDLAAPVKSVADAIGSGKEAAIALDLLLSKKAVSADSLLKAFEKCRVGAKGSVSFEAYLGGPRSKRSHNLVSFADLNTARIPLSRRTESLLNLNEAVREAERCMSCGLCNDCDDCRTFCPDAAVIYTDGVRKIDERYCKGCGICVRECPRGVLLVGPEEAGA